MMPKHNQNLRRCTECSIRWPQKKFQAVLISIKNRNLVSHIKQNKIFTQRRPYFFLEGERTRTIDAAMMEKIKNNNIFDCIVIPTYPFWLNVFFKYYSRKIDYGKLSAVKHFQKFCLWIVGFTVSKDYDKIYLIQQFEAKWRENKL